MACLDRLVMAKWNHVHFLLRDMIEVGYVLAVFSSFPPIWQAGPASSTCAARLVVDGGFRVVVSALVC
jgi:hypothetical protein